MSSPTPLNPPLDTWWNRTLQVSRPYISLDSVWQAMLTFGGYSISYASHGDGMQEAPSPTAPCTLDKKLYPADTPKRMDSCPSSAAYMPTLSVSWQYFMDYTPSQPFCLHWSGGLPCQKNPSRNTAPLGSRKSWARQECRNQCKRRTPATGPPV